MMAKKSRLNAYKALAEGQGAEITKTVPALANLERSLSADQEIDPSLIDPWGPTDRMDEEFTVVNSAEGSSLSELKESIELYGQNTPIRVRPSHETPGRYQIIYGRRRLRACQELGINVKASVVDMDDATALMAKGAENALRRPLSFYEKALFVQNIIESGVSAKRAGEIIAASKATVSHLTKVTDTVPKSVGVAIGAAVTSGRRQWWALSDAFTSLRITEQDALGFLASLPADLTSDARLAALTAKCQPDNDPQHKTATRTPTAGVSIKAGQGLAIKVDKGPFADWLDEHLDDLLTEAKAQFEATSKKE